MRKIHIILIMLFGWIAFSLPATFAQEEADKETYAYFVVLYTVGENWDTELPPQEQEYMADHSKHLQALRKSEAIRVGGRYGEYGMLIIRAKDEQEARLMVMEDVSVQHEMFNAEIYPANLFYKGCIE